jgi:hypothetical protein
MLHRPIEPTPSSGKPRVRPERGAISRYQANLAEARSPERQGRDELDLSSLRAELADLDASAR